jgi:hypothetical protein
MRSCDVESCAHCPIHRKLSQLEAFQVDGPEWSTQEDSIIQYSSHIWEQILDNVHKHLSFTFLLVSFSCGALLQYIVYLVLTVIVSDGMADVVDVVYLT